MANTETAYLPLMGGLDLVSPALNIQPGYLIDCLNYIPAINGGYQRVAGYERFDGQVAPSARTVTGLLVELGGFTLGETISGPDGSGVLVVMENQNDGTLLGLCSVTGTITEGDTVTNGQHSARVLLDFALNQNELMGRKDWIASIETHYRNKITQPAGDGAIEGIYEHKGRVMAFRRSGDQVAVSLSSEQGWQAMAIENELLRYQTGGVNIPIEGATLTGHSSGASAEVLRSIRYGGSSDENSVSGYLLLKQASISGAFQDGEYLISGQYAGGSLSSSPFQLLHAIDSTDLKLYPQAGDVITTEGGASGKLAEAMAANLVDQTTQQLAFILTEVTGTFKKDDELLFPQPDTEDGTAVDPVKIGKVSQSAEALYKLEPVSEQLPLSGDLLVFPAGEAVLNERMAIVQDDESLNHYLRLKETTGTINPGDTVQVKIIAARAQGEQWPVAFTAGGRFEFVEFNFYAGTETFRLYGCNGIDPAFEFSDGVFLPILMPDQATLNNPHCIEAHKSHLFLGFTSGLVRHSVIGEPLSFNGEIGAVEIGVGDPVTDIASISGGVLVIASRNRTHILYGDHAENWQMKMIAREAGALTGSIQTMGNTYMLDDAGIVDLARVEAFGDYEMRTVSRLIQPVINRFTGPMLSAAYRDLNQIRFYSTTTGSVIVLKPEESAPQITLLSYPVKPVCICSTEDESGRSAVWFGSAEGWVYRDGMATSFDGEPVESAIQTSYWGLQSPNIRKAFKRLELDFSGYNDVYLRIHGELDYSEGYTPAPGMRELYLFGGGGFWDRDQWNEFYWSSAAVTNASTSLTGTGKNLSLMVYNKDAWTQPFTLQGFMLHYIPRRLDRG